MNSPFPATRPRRFSRATWMSFCAMACLVLGGKVQAFDCYLKLEGIPGEITSGNFEGWSKITNLATRISTTPATDPATPVPATMAMVLSKPLDKTSPLLFRHCAGGLSVPRLTLVCLDSSVLFLRITLSDVIVSSIAVRAPDGPPMETVDLTYQKIEWSCVKEDFVSGGITTTFDLPTQQGGSKVRPPFLATLERRAGQSGLQVTCPVEAGHRYRIAGNTSLTGPWTTLLEFTATEDGIAGHPVSLAGGALFIRVDEVE